MLRETVGNIEFSMTIGCTCCYVLPTSLTGSGCAPSSDACVVQEGGTSLAAALKLELRRPLLWSAEIT